MNRNKCLGCGIKLQYEDPSLPGYIPPAKQGKALVCQRCYQLRHYGKLQKGRVTGDSALRSVKAALRGSEVVLVVVDLFDPEGSLPEEWATLFNLPVVLVVNKADLLPPRTSWLEMEEWFTTLWKRKFPAAELLAVKAFSTKKKGPVFTQKAEELKTLLEGKKVMVLGAANVGKTSLLTVLLTQNKTQEGKIPTTSKYPGTTQGINSWLIRSHAITLLDTPGLVPGRRMGDLLSPVGASRLLPENKLQVKIWEVPPQGAVLLGGLGGVWNRSATARTLLFFTAEATTLHRTQGEKAELLLAEAPEWLRAFALKERPQKFDKKMYTVQPGEDLYFSGLGWVAVKKEAIRLRVLAPVGVEVGTRPSLIGKKPG